MNCPVWRQGFFYNDMTPKEIYAERLKDPRWQRKRLEILSRDQFRCRKCGATDKTLHVHHLRYHAWFNPWDEDNGFLMTLCSDCHKQERQADVDIGDSVGGVYKATELFIDELTLIGATNVDFSAMAIDVGALSACYKEKHEAIKYLRRVINDFCEAKFKEQ